MLYAILAYHEEDTVSAMSPDEDAALMAGMMKVHDKIDRKNRLGPAARLDKTGNAVTLRGPGEPMVIDGPFAETKEQLLGFYVLECDTLDAAVAAARDLQRVNTSAVYEIRPITLYLPGAAVQGD
ncbi:YciI family protein [Nitratireductor sp. CAU 1489]|uniref:YciI family protein n=1 Tax=Nitratireductor arenosus TaxID=2682096 RepID=A0A844QCK5_9HYPH|nr:YciI family protein [Nitratireductor arenosus]MVA95750.1 YciI family protein [Nitratireductor arenosus]